MRLINARDLAVAYNGSTALQDITFEVEHPSFIAVIGPNGAGKSTLLKAMMGQLRPVRGALEVLDIDVSKNPGAVRKAVGYVPQRERINFEVPLKVKDVVLMGLLAKARPPRVPSRREAEAARRALVAVGLGELWEENFSQLSGGQQQRVLVARAIAADPEVLLLDEPFLGVDTKSFGEMIAILRNFRLRNRSVVLVTHDVNPIVDCVDKILLLNKKLIAFGTPKEVLTEKFLVEAYGPIVKIIEHKGLCFAITGDVHA